MTLHPLRARMHSQPQTRRHRCFMASPGRLCMEYTALSIALPGPPFNQDPTPYPTNASQRHGYLLQISHEVSSVFTVQIGLPCVFRIISRSSRSMSQSIFSTPDLLQTNLPSPHLTFCMHKYIVLSLWHFSMPIYL